MNRPHPGRRGRALIGFACLDIAMGIRLLTVHPSTTDFYAWLPELLPLWVWSIPWFTVAALCLLQVFASCDRAAFAGAIGVKVLWACLYLCGWLFGVVSDAWLSACVWATFAWCVWIIAGSPEPIQRRGLAWTPPLQ